MAREQIPLLTGGLVVSTNGDGREPIRVMLIDDGSLFLRTVLTFLQMAPEVAVVGTVGGLVEAQALVCALGAEIVISDLASAGLPDLTALSQLHAAFPEVGVIVLTLLDLEPYRQAALAAGAAEFVSRMSAGTDLLPAIRRVAVASEPKGSGGLRPAEAVRQGTGKRIEIALHPV